MSRKTWGTRLEFQTNLICDFEIPSPRRKMTNLPQFSLRAWLFFRGLNFLPILSPLHAFLYRKTVIAPQMSQLKISSSWPHFSVPTSVLIDEGTLSKSRMTICELYLKPQSPGSNIIFFRETDGREFIPCVISCNTRSYRVSVGLKPCLRDACLVKTFVEGEREEDWNMWSNLEEKRNSEFTPVLSEIRPFRSLFFPPVFVTAAGISFLLLKCFLSFLNKETPVMILICLKSFAWFR